MFDYKLIQSKIGKKIGLLVFINIFFIIISFSILFYYQSQMTHLGDSINVAGKNRFLTSNLMFHVSEYFLENKSDVSKINSAIDQLESNILVLRQGGNVTNIDLKPLPIDFLNDWNKIYREFVSLKTILINNITINKADDVDDNGEQQFINSKEEYDTQDKVIKDMIEQRTLSLVDSSNVLVTKLGEYVRNSSEHSLFLQTVFAVLNIVVTAAFVFYIIRNLLRPIFDLTSATSEVSRGNLDVVVKSKGHNDELSVLTKSFNSMITSIKNYIKKQNELKKELEKANEELKYRDQLKDEFINIAAHELKTPIQPIVGLCEILRDRETDIEKDEEILDIIIRNSKRLKKLAEDILNVAKIESGSFILKKEKFDLKKMITDILREYEQKILESKKNIKLSYEFHHNDNNNDEIIIEADRNRLSQVIYNLLNNAINFTNEGSIIVIVDERKNGGNNNNDNNEILVSIKDTGTGIDPEILPKLFTKFATKSMTGGTGLGLFISKKIIEMHGGKIWATNNNSSVDDDGRETNGSTFTFSLPINNNNNNNKYILLVDDDKDTLYTFDTYLKSIGYPIVSFLSPVEALDYFERNFTNCALVITDYNMPQMSGFNLIKKIREKDQKYGIKIILISATIKNNFTTYYDDKLSDLKINKFLEKPMPLEKLENEIKILIE
jgi:signal transduction histidine kinase/CheY-like chemotaxis protein